MVNLRWYAIPLLNHVRTFEIVLLKWQNPEFRDFKITKTPVTVFFDGA